MKSKADITQLIQNFDDEIDNKVDWLNYHINLMFLEICEIKDAVYIFDTVEKEWNRRTSVGEKVNYSAIRTILYYSLPYRIILGLSKIFIGEKEFSLSKTVNIIGQMNEYKNNNDIKKVIIKIKDYLDSNVMLKVVATLRDKFFAHLDKICVNSDCRIDLSVAMRDIDSNEINRGIELIVELYEKCFDYKLEYDDDKLEIDDIIYTFFGGKYGVINLVALRGGL